MPSSALDAVRADMVGDPGTLALAIYWWVHHQPGESAPSQGEKVTTYQAILAHLQATYGIEFNLYKQGTILRRLERRMSKHAISGLPDYLTLLSNNREESDALLDDLLIGVTSFFRDQRVFEHLRADIIPALVRRRMDEPEIRVWVAGCATGEEAYALAMLLHEAASVQNYPGRLRIFATDVHRATLETASHGTYALEPLDAVPADLFDRYVLRQPGAVDPCAPQAGRLRSPQCAGRSRVHADRSDQLPQPAHLFRYQGA